LIRYQREQRCKSSQLRIGPSRRERINPLRSDAGAQLAPVQLADEPAFQAAGSEDGTVGLLTTSGTTRQGYLKAGRAFQRVWLAATKLGLALHPLGSLPIFLERLRRQGGQGLAEHHKRSLARVSQRFFRLFPGAEGRGLVILFRLGQASPCSVRSLR